MHALLVCSGGYNKVPQTGWLINSKNAFLPGLLLKVWGHNASFGWGSTFGFKSSNCIHIWQRGKWPLWGLFITSLIPFMRAPPSWPNHLPKAPPPNIITLGIRFTTCEFGAGECKHSDHSVCLQKTFNIVQGALWMEFSELGEKLLRTSEADYIFPKELQ